MAKCTGINCPMQFNKVEPRSCSAAQTCEYATPPIKRADCIRAMTNEELAKLLSEFAYCYECPAKKYCESTDDGCVGGILAYLESEATHDA